MKSSANLTNNIFMKFAVLAPSLRIDRKAAIAARGILAQNVKLVLAYRIETRYTG